MIKLLPLLAIVALLLASVSVAKAQATIPTVSTVAITSSPGADNTYGPGDTITVGLTFSEAVAVNTTDGTPHVVLDIGGQPRNAAYTGAGTTAGQVLFGYTVLVGDHDTDGVSVIADSLTLNGGTIQATDDSADANLAHTAMTFANHKVDTVVTLVSNLNRPSAHQPITLTSAQDLLIQALAPSGPSGFGISEIVLDVKTPSDTLDVTLRISPTDGRGFSYTYSGSVATAGLQTFTLSSPAQERSGNVRHVSGGSFLFGIEIIASGPGSVELESTAPHQHDTGSLEGWALGGPGGGALVPKIRLRGYTAFIPRLKYFEVISSPMDGNTYAAGERIEFLLAFSKRINDLPTTTVLSFSLGRGPQHRREAGLVGIAPGLFDDVFLFAYTVQAEDTGTDGIYLEENPLGDNAGVEFHSYYGPDVPADISLAARQLGTDLLVDGSRESACEEVRCGTLVAEVLGLAQGMFAGQWYFDTGSGYRPFSPLGKLSSSTFEYGEDEYAVVQTTRVVLPTSERVLEVILDPGLAERASNRLALQIDGRVFLLSAADVSSDGEYFQWNNPGLTWAENDEIELKIIETATATFDAARYAKTEGDSFDVTVTLGASFENTLTLPIVVTHTGGATDADYSGIPENLVFMPGDTQKTFTVTIIDDSADDDDESLMLSFSDPHIRSGGTNEQATIAINDNDTPEAGFGESSYQVAEGGTATVEVTLTSAAASAVSIPITKTDQGGATSADYSGVPSSVAIAAGQTSGSFTFTAETDTVDDGGESVKLTFGTLPNTVQAGTPNESTVYITDSNDPQVTAQFGAASYTAAEGGTASVSVTLSADPERTVIIPVTATNQGGATAADYSVPSSVTFASGQTSRTLTFSATQDDLDDDGESVRLTFGTLPPRVSAGTTAASTVSITDDDDPPVTVQFGQSAHTVAEGGTQTVTVTLSADPERTVVIAIEAANQDGATAADYSVPSSVTFNVGETSKTIDFSATQDPADDDDERVELAFGTLPSRVSEGSRARTTISITDDDDPQVTVQFGQSAHTVAEGGTATVTVSLSEDRSARSSSPSQRRTRAAPPPPTTPACRRG